MTPIHVSILWREKSFPRSTGRERFTPRFSPCLYLLSYPHMSLLLGLFYLLILPSVLRVVVNIKMNWCAVPV
jgi:hypothetical protein